MSRKLFLVVFMGLLCSDSALAVGYYYEENQAQSIEPGRQAIPHNNVRSCEQISRNRSQYSQGRVGYECQGQASCTPRSSSDRYNKGVTQYFAPRFSDLNGRRRRDCYDIEGTCIVDDILHNVGMAPRDLSTTNCKYGFGTGVNDYNPTNCLDPCRTVAADPGEYPIGTVLFFPSMAGKICPQTGQPVDGCFVVGDGGGWIRGEGRFDFFTGDCLNYDRGVCRDRHNLNFSVDMGEHFYVVPRNDSIATALRGEQTSYLNSLWNGETLYTERSTAVTRSLRPRMRLIDR